MTKSNFKNKEIQLLVLFGVLTLMFISVNFANNYSPQENYFFDDKLPKSAAISINIVSPTTDENFSSTPPDFLVEISDDVDTIDTMWYTIDLGITNITFTTNGTIDLGNWTALSDGALTLTFYANNSLSEVQTASVSINKDTIDPVVVITSPTGIEYFDTTAPDYVVEISDSGSLIDMMWYTIDNGITNTTFIVNGTIDQTEWTAHPEGSVTIIFFANDSAGNENSAQVIVNKDTVDPSVSITDPIGGEYYDATAPSFTVEVSDTNLDTMWYTIDGGATNITFLVNGTIDQTEWTAHPEGSVTIIFFANDSASNENSAQVIVNKDTVDPSVSITNPTGGEYYSVTAPNFIVEIDDDDLDTMWYTIDGGATNITFLVNGTIDQTEWTAHPEGPVTIIFFANDSVGHENSAQVIVNKDTVDPSVSITDPTGGEYYSVTAPSFTVEIDDDDLDTMWYTIDGGATNITFLVNGTIDQTEWTAHPEGSVTIIFFANDSAGNENSAQVIVNKDTVDPSVSITNPTGGEYYGATAPSFIVEISDTGSPIDTMWYTIDGGATNITFLVNGTIDQTEWTTHPEGPVTIEFYANDTVGIIGFDSIVVNKDTGNPTVSITTPTGGEFYDANAPNYVVEISDSGSPIDTMWYTIDNGITNTTFIVNGTIDQTEWTAHIDGLVTIIFYANDSAGNENSAQVVVNKDVLDPTVAITSPTGGQYFDATAPGFIVEIFDDNLDTMWYTINGGVTNITFVVNGTIDQTEWTAHPEGSVTIIFYTNDSAGNLAFDQVIVNKDTTAPVINIISPQTAQTFGILAPNLIVEIDDDTLDTMWYNLNGGANITFTVNGTINQLYWAAIPNGAANLTFFANDTFGHFNSVLVDFNKNADAPVVIIISPILASYYGVTAPSFVVEIADDDLDTMWYTIDGGATNITFTVNGTIDQTEWTAHSDGSVTLIFYANDLAGNFAFDIRLINKDTAAPTVNIVSPSLLQLLGVNPPSFIVEIDDPILDTMWYSLDNGVTNFTFTFNRTFDLSAWGSVSNGTVTIYFYANDLVGNEAFDSVVVRVDKFIPTISIILPTNNTVVGTAPWINIIVNDVNVDSIWYIVNPNPYIILANNSNQQLEVWIWNGLLEGAFTIELFANDTAGNLSNFYTLNLIKDISPPIVDIMNPFPNATFTSAPLITLIITDVTLDTTWYSILGTNYEFTATVGTNHITINQAAWNSLSEGSVTITFYANDSLGRLDTDSITLNKDIPEDPEVFDWIAFLTDPIVLTIIVSAIAIAIVVILLLRRRKFHRTSDKEVKKIESLWE